ncbi:transcription elongation factor Spt5 [Candidatus Woesearchaeota archaeon]|nr:transcription elongation factor Spt5 [Candidatus Woesearchaeota archaeon]
MESQIFVLRTTANREEQVIDFVSSNAQKKKLEVYSIIHPHGMRGYVFLEAKDRQAAEESFIGIPYAKGLLPKPVEMKEIEPMLEQVAIKVNIQKNDIVEIITGPFKHEKAKVIRIDLQKEEVVLEILETAVPIPLTLKLDSVKVIRRENPTEEESL